MTPTIANVYTNNNSIPVNGVVESDQRSGYTMLFTGTISGTGTFVEATGLTNIFVGTFNPGFSPGALTFDRPTGVFVFGTSADRLMLEIENGDLLAFTNLAAPLALGNIDVTFLNSSTLGDTNWFLTADSGVQGAFNSTSFVMYTFGTVMYDYPGKRVGVYIVPEPLAAVCAAVLCALACGCGAGRRQR